MRSLLTSCLLLIFFVPCLYSAFAVTEAKSVFFKQPVRALHIVIRNVEVSDVLRIAEMAKKSGFNTVIVAISDGVKFDTFPGLARPDAWSRNEMMTVVSRIRALGMVVIPEVKLLSHQEKLFGNSRPELMFNRRTYNPSKEEVYKTILPYLDEIINLFNPPAVHIAHDEIAGFIFKTKLGIKRRVWLESGEAPLPAELFLLDVQRIHAYLKHRNIETWMWGDMLFSPDEFPDMLESDLHGTIPGYGRALRSKLPKDIVICDWHYSSKQADFPTLAILKREGFCVLGATWKDSKTINGFSRYAAAHGADGMIATTWFHVQRKEWNIVDTIIKVSGQAFLSAFPDSR